MTPKQVAKLLVQRHFEIGALLIDEAIQCALVTAQYMNSNEIIDELNQLKIKEYDASKGTALEKYWVNKSTEQIIKQMELF
jgi:hypothetical protein